MSRIDNVKQNPSEKFFPIKRVLNNKIIWFLRFLISLNFIMVILLWTTNLFDDAINSYLQLQNGTLSFAWWQRPVVRAVYRIHIFNYTNIKEFETGQDKKLRVSEIGPFVYRETLIRLNPDINKHTITYQEMRSYQWEGGLSDDTIIIVPNVPLFTAMAFSRDLNFLAQVSLTAILSTIRAKPFISLTASEFLWGYDDKLFHIARPVMSWQQNIPYERFGMLAFKNGLSKDKMTIDTGTANFKNLGNTILINGQKTRKIWNDKKCDRIEGSDGSMFSPSLIKNKLNTLKIYSKEMCRPIPLKFFGQSNELGIPTLRYKLPEDVFTSNAVHNSCFCRKKKIDINTTISVCSPKGIFNSSACNFGAPMLSSFPHFYQADKSLFNQIDGLKPNIILHDTYIDIHPRLAVPVGGWSRVQINLEARKADAVPFMGHIQDGTILPILWIEVGIDKIPKTIMNLLYQAYYVLNAVEIGLKWGSFLITASSIIILGLTLYQRTSYKIPKLHRNISGQDKLISIIFRKVQCEI